MYGMHMSDGGRGCREGLTAVTGEDDRTVKSYGPGKRGLDNLILSNEFWGD